MSDLYAINLNLQERLERDWREKVRAAEAAVWLDDAGLLRNYKNGLPLRRLLRKGRIAGQEQRPNQKNGSWGIRHLAESRDSIAIQQVRQSMRRYLPIDQDILHTDWPLSRDNSGFWEELGRATVTQSTPSQLSGASSAVRTSRNPTTQGSRVSISPQRSAPPACRPARLRTLVSGATGDCFSAPFPTSISAARSGLAPPRELAPGDERRIRRCMARAAIPHIRATHYAPSDAGRSASGRQSSCAPYRSPVPDSPVRTPAKCLWTGRAYWLSSVSSVQRTGTEMVCIGMATYRHRTEVRTPGRLDARRDYSALSATLIEQNDSEPLAAARCWCAGWMCLGRQIRGLAAVHGREGGGGSAATTGKTIPCGRKYAETIACAGFQAARTRLPRRCFTRDNSIYREQPCQVRHRARMRTHRSPRAARSRQGDLYH